MRVVIKKVFPILSAWLLCYLAVSFVGLEIDFRQWDVSVRAFYIFLCVVLTGLILITLELE